jgi:hypothetical protein
MKNKKNLTYWLSVAVIGIALGFALQFVRAWTEPTTTPPGGNVGAPINTGAIDQTKGNATSGKISAKDFCLNSDPTKCLSTVGGPTGSVCDNDGTCDTAAGETESNCYSDCHVTPPSGPVCGNGSCESGEASSCCGDCETCAPPVQYYRCPDYRDVNGLCGTNCYGQTQVNPTCWWNVAYQVCGDPCQGYCNGVSDISCEPI